MRKLSILLLSIPAIFIVIHIHGLFQKPEITFSNIQQFSDKVIIAGEVDRPAFFTINDRQVILDIENKFRETIYLQGDYSVTKIKAIDRRGKEKIQIIEFIKIEDTFKPYFQ